VSLKQTCLLGHGTRDRKATVGKDGKGHGSLAGRPILRDPLKTRKRPDVGGQEEMRVFRRTTAQWLLVESTSGGLERTPSIPFCAFATATGTSSWKNLCSFNCSSINLTSTMIPRDALSSDHQYQPSCVGGVVVRGRGACDGLSFDVGVMLGRLGRPWGCQGWVMGGSGLF